MMDKAKAYDEALEKARKQRDDYQKELDKTDKNSQLASLLRAGISAVEMIFPQLKENDDERIRKDIISALKFANYDGVYDKHIVYLEKQKECLTDNTSEDEKMLRTIIQGFENWKGNGMESFNNTNIDDILVYLEKQKKPKVDIDKLRRDLYQSGYNDGYQHGKEDAQKEQKPVDDKAFEEWIDDWFKEHKEKAYPQITMDEKEFKNFCRGIRNMYQQKSDWNEEDEKMIKTIIDVLERSSQVTTYEQRGGLMSALVGCSDIYKKEIEWLKDIFLNHKKFNEAVDKLCSNEWSEEDEKDLAHIIEILDDCYAFGRHDLSKTNHENLVNKLKSLRPQPKKELSIEKAIQWLDDTFYFLDNSSGRGRDCEITTHDFDSLEEMYDSFRKAVTVDSQSTWKPIEEQEEQKSHLIVNGKGVYKICPHCKSYMIRDDSMVYTSMPPQYRYECPKCGESECDTVMYDNPEMEEQKSTGWRHYIWTINLRFDFTALIKYDNTDNYEIVQAGNRPKQEKNGVYILIKDIKPQSHWKPSEEQMEALKDAVRLFKETHFEKFHYKIESLYEQLLKLGVKEEAEYYQHFDPDC